MCKDWIYELPKVELHCHLDGSLPVQVVRELARMSKIEILPTDEELQGLLMVTEDCQSLVEYLKKFNLPIACLQKKETLEYASYSLLKEAASEHVIYMEIRFAPLVCMQKGLSCKEVIESVQRGIDKARQEFGIIGKIIVCAMRHESPEKNIAMLEEIKEYIGDVVCAADLAGNEMDFPPLLHLAFFEKAKELGLPYTIHAGECGSAESVLDAIFLGTKRIGHGIALMKNDTIRNLVKEEGVTLEMCPSSNLQTKAVDCISDYPLCMFMREGIRVTLNTDNRTVTGTTLTEEFRIMVREFKITKEEAIQMTENAINAAFADDKTKQLLMEKLHIIKTKSV